MKKILVFSVIFMILLSCISSIVYATDSDDGTVYGSSGTQPTSVTFPDTSVTIGSVGSSAGISQPSLDLSNILSIILVVLGILMVLFAIALLIRIR